MSSRRSGRLAVAGLLLLAGCDGGSSPVTPSPACSFTVAPLSQSFSSDGGTGAVTVTTTPACAWTAASGSAWIAVAAGASGTGTGTVSYQVSANPGTESRAGTLTIAGQSHAVTQSGREVQPCTYAISPDRLRVAREGATGSVAVTAASGCAWDATSSAAWLTIVSGITGSGDGVVSYSVARNTGPERTATIAIATQTFTLTQQGEAPVTCSYTVDPVTLAPCMAAGVMSSAVRTSAGCTWTATEGVSWLSIDSGSSGSGSGSVVVRFGDNYDAPREGVVMVRWPTATAGQNIRVMQAGCIYGVSRDTISIGAAGGTTTFDVLQQSQPTSCGGPLQDRCVWTAKSDVSWIVVTTSMPQTGDDRVTLSVSANSGAASRTGHVTVRDKTVTITQAGQ